MGKLKIDYGLEVEAPSTYGTRVMPDTIINTLPEVGSVGYIREKRCYSGRSRKDKYMPAVKYESGKEALVKIEGYTVSDKEPFAKGNRLIVTYGNKKGYVGRRTFDTVQIGCGKLKFFKKDEETDFDK